MQRLSLKDYGELALLSAIWGSSFLFIRIAVPEFGPAFLIELRVLSGFLFLFPFCIYSGKHKEVFRHWKLITLISLLNMSIPFSLIAFASLSIGAGLASVLNSTVPFFSALVAYFFWGQKLSFISILGLIVGFIGVGILVFDPNSDSPASTNSIAIIAVLIASAFYGVAVNITANKLTEVSGLAITVGSLFVASITMAPFAFRFRPQGFPEIDIWLSVIALGVLCTGIAYMLFYRLISRIGSHQAITTTFMIPMFSILWGATFLGESITGLMLLGGFTVLVGVAMTTGRVPVLFKNKL